MPPTVKQVAEVLHPITKLIGDLTSAKDFGEGCATPEEIGEVRRVNVDIPGTPWSRLKLAGNSRDNVMVELRGAVDGLKVAKLAPVDTLNEILKAVEECITLSTGDLRQVVSALNLPTEMLQSCQEAKATAEHIKERMRRNRASAVASRREAKWMRENGELELAEDGAAESEAAFDALVKDFSSLQHSHRTIIAEWDSKRMGVAGTINAVGLRQSLSRATFESYRTSVDALLSELKAQYNKVADEHLEWARKEEDEAARLTDRQDELMEVLRKLVDDIRGEVGRMADLAMMRWGAEGRAAQHRRAIEAVRRDYSEGVAKIRDVVDEANSMIASARRGAAVCERAASTAVEAFDVAFSSVANWHSDMAHSMSDLEEALVDRFDDAVQACARVERQVGLHEDAVRHAKAKFELCVDTLDPEAKRHKDAMDTAARDLATSRSRLSKLKEECEEMEAMVKRLALRTPIEKAKLNEVARGEEMLLYYHHIDSAARPDHSRLQSERDDIALARRELSTRKRRPKASTPPPPVSTTAASEDDGVQLALKPALPPASPLTPAKSKLRDSLVSLYGFTAGELESYATLSDFSRQAELLRGPQRPPPTVSYDKVRTHNLVFGSKRVKTEANEECDTEGQSWVAMFRKRVLLTSKEGRKASETSTRSSSVKDLEERLEEFAAPEVQTWSGEVFSPTERNAHDSDEGKKVSSENTISTRGYRILQSHRGHLFDPDHRNGLGGVVRAVNEAIRRGKYGPIRHIVKVKNYWPGMPVLLSHFYAITCKPVNWKQDEVVLHLEWD